MSQRVNIPSQNQPFRRQSSIGGNVSFRNIGENEDNSFITLAKVTRVYYKQGKLDFKLTNTNSLVADQSGNGSGSAPIPVDFFGRRPNGKVFGHYRPVKIGDLIAVAYVNGHKSSPIVIGVYPNSGQDYEIISPSLYLDGDDNNSGIAETALAEQKIYPSMQLEYRSGSGTIAKALNGHSFLVVDDETSVQYSKLWQNYNTVGFFHSDSDDINPLKETAGDWLLIHEDNPLSDDGDNHRTRFFVNKKGEIQIVLMDNTSSGTISVLEGSKDNGFTISQYYDLTKTKSGDLSDDVYEPDFKSATDYVSLNVGKGKQIALDAAGQTKLVIKKDGIYYNGKPLSKAVINSESNNITNDVKDQITSSDDWKNLQDTINKASSEARDAAEQAKQAGENAKVAGAAAEAAGKNALDTGDDIKKRIIYYASISKEKDIAIPGKYIIINTDTYIKNGTIKNAYIEDGAIDHAKIANEAVWSSQIANLAVTRAKIADAAIGSAQIEDLAVTDEKVGKLTFDHMVGATLDAGQINVINLKADSIVAGTITADKLNIKGLSDITSNAGTISKGRIQAGDDPNSGVVIDNLDADNPNKYTPAKKAFLLSEVKKLNSAAEAAIDYGKQTGVDYSAVEKAKQAMDDGLASLLGDMATTAEFDYNTVIKLEQDLQDAINAFHSKSNSDIMAQIGTTADGKNAIYRGANDPVTMGVQPHENDMWLQILSNGTYNIRVWDGAQWINPGLADIKAVSDSLSNLPKSYYQAEEPVGDSVHDGDTWYKLTKGSDGKYTYVAYKREGNSWTPLLNAGEVSNQSSINTLQSDLEQARELIKDDGGGINLYTGTENFSDIAGRSWFHRSDANWALTDRRDPNGNLEMQKNGGAWNGLGQAISVEPGKYTFSCYLWVHLTGNETLNFYAGDNQYGGTATVGATDGTTQFTVNDSEKYIHVTITYNVTKGGVLAIRPELNQDSGTFWVSSYKLEKGSQATPWCHNGNDYMAGIAAVQEDVNSATAAIQQAKANATSEAAAIRNQVADVANNVSSVKADVASATSDVANLKVDVQANIAAIIKTNEAVSAQSKSSSDAINELKIANGQVESIAKDAQNNATVAKQTADTATTLAQDAKSNAVLATQTATSATVEATNASSAVAKAELSVNGLTTRVNGIEGDTKNLSGRVASTETILQQTKDQLLQKADKSVVDQANNLISQLSAEQKVMAGQISQKVSSAEYQTLRDKVNGIQVGTSNLLHDTSDQWRTLTNDGDWLQKTTASSCWTSTSDYHGGNEFTYAAKITNNSHQQAELEVWLFDQNKNWINGQAFHAPIPKGANAYDVNVTFPITTGTWYIRSWIIFTGGHAPHGDQIQVKDERLVRGNLAGTWEANPNDTITSIQKNTTAIDENSKAIKLKADQTEVDNVKNTASYNSSRLDVMNNEIKSKVSSTDVNNIVDSKGYATQNTVQSLIDQKAGKINESITNLEGKFNSSSSVNLAEKTNQGTTNWTVGPGNGASTISEVNINGIRGVRFTQTRKSTSWWVIAYQLNLDYFEPNQDYIISFDVRTSSDNFNQGGMLNIARGDSSHAYLANTSFRTNFKKNQLTHVSCTGHSYSSLDKNGETFYLNCLGLGQCDWVDIVNLKIARGTIDKGYSPAPSDNATVTQIQQVTASINGLKSIVVNKDGITSMINQKADSIEAGITGKLSSLNYGGLVLDKNGATLTSGNTHVYLNGTNGFQIQNGTSDVFHVDRSGNLTMQGNITGGNITGVNFTGSNLTLTGDLRVINKENKVGHILLGNTAVLDSQGLSIKGAGLFISDNQNNLTTYVDQYGTFVTNKGVFNGNVTATSLTIREGSQADINVAGNFMVNSSGDVIAKSITITGGTVDAKSTKFNNFSADIITTGTIDANRVAVKNLSADNITTGTLDANKVTVKNFSADNIVGGTLSGVVVKTGANDRYFQTSKDNIYWVRNGSMSLVGNDTYLNSANGLNIADEKNIQLTTWGGATVNKDGSITNNSGNSGHPKIVIDLEGKYNPDDIYGSAFGGGPGDSEIVQWVSNKEYTALTRNQGFTVHLDDGNNNSIFAIQKDNKVGFYVGGGDDGSEIRIAGVGPIKLQGRYVDDGFDDGMTHTFGNLQVDNIHVRKWLGVDGSKNSIVRTSQGTVAINAYETAEYYFGDIGEGQTDSNGVAYVGIEKLFNETVNTSIPYQVFITAYGPGNVWVEQRKQDRFMIKSSQPNIKFGWEIKAKRKGYEHTRLQNVDNMIKKPAGIR